MGTIKAVFFDADDTIFSVYPSVAHHYNAILGEYGALLPEETLTEIVKQCWKEHMPHYENRQNGYRTSVEQDKALWVQYARKIVSKALSPDHPAEIPHKIYDRFSRGNTRRVLNGFHEAISILKERGLFIGVFTNNDMRTHRVLDELGVSPLFDTILTAGEVGYKKPAKEAFEHLLTHSGTKPHETAYIGDSLEHDCIGAHEAGWKAIWLNHKKAPLPPGLSISEIYYLSELSQSGNNFL